MNMFANHHFKHQIPLPRAKAGLCGELHVRAKVDELECGSISATVQPEDFDNIVSSLQPAKTVEVKKRKACPAHDSKLWSDLKHPRISIRKILSRILLFVLSILYILSPPWPPLMMRKAIFCPPPRGSYYYLIGYQKNGKKKACFYAHEAIGMERVAICLPQMLHPKIRAVDVYYHLLRCKTIILPFNETQYFCAMELSCEQSIRWLHRDKSRTIKRSPYLIIFSQPNSSDLGCCLMMDPNFADMADFLQCDMLIYDYPGYGVSDGESTEKNIYVCSEAVFKYATDKLGYAPENIILMGFSLGTAAMIHIAEMQKVGAVVLIAPFTSFSRILLRCPSMATPIFDMFPSLEKSEKITSPTLICHGQRDIIVSHAHGVQLQKKIPNSELYSLKHASHQGIFCEREMWDEVERFLGHRVQITAKWSELLQKESAFSEITEVAVEPVFVPSKTD
ncbi:unnamed protein product [Caenorhabditis auriculariae]|uniref:AB hydrolase-1 domain-containing protein n=1 Tax=Caenorhabditis auriculariae TaxID=2777116 RepID=A0A8S1H6B2_9PELO|nr:unnamed protein product [Caenorhabditis auriculariae]